MTGLSAMMGAIAPNLLNKTTTHYVATGLFFLFGLRSVYDQTVGYDANAESELEEVEKELKEHTSSSSSRTRGRGGRGGKTGPATRTRTKAKKQSPGSKINDILSVFFSPIFLQAFLMTFLAEWGDRSQIATIALAADYDPIGVTLGGICGHGLCTSAAVLGGKRMAGAISERMVGLCGGILFLAFGVHALVVGEWNSWKILREIERLRLREIEREITRLLLFIDIITIAHVQMYRRCTAAAKSLHNYSKSDTCHIR